MLVCNVSLRPPRRAITVALAEAAAAMDATVSGQVVFAILVDDPASVHDTVDAYLGEIMLEAASASDTVSSGTVYVASVDESAGSASAQDGTIPTALMARSAMVMGVYVNSDGTSREANAGRIMVNL